LSILSKARAKIKLGEVITNAKILYFGRRRKRLMRNEMEKINVNKLYMADIEPTFLDYYINLTCRCRSMS